MLIKRGLPILIKLQLIVSIFLFLSLWLYHPLTSFFSQDDFFHLRAISQKEFIDIPQFFLGPQKEYGFFRPLSRETYNLILYKIFGLNPFPFHLVNLILITVNSFLIYNLFKKIIKNLSMAYLTTFLYIVSSVHSVELYYLGSVQQLFATTFLLISTILFVSNRYFLSVGFFLLAVLSHELAIVQPAILFFLSVFLTKNRSVLELKGIFKKVIPFILISWLCVYIIISLTLPKQTSYAPLFNIKSVVNNLVWYFLWSLGLPETIVDFIGPGFKINPNFIIWFRSYSYTVFPLFGLTLLAILFIIFRKIKNLNIELIFLFLSLFTISISPFLFFPKHKFVYYLAFSSIWVYGGLASILLHERSNSFIRALLVFIIASYIVISYQTIKLNQSTYWASKRAAAAKVILQDLKQTYPSTEANTVFYIVDDLTYPYISEEWGTSSKQAFYILSGSDALKLLYNNDSIETYYQAMGGLPDNVGNKKVIHYAAKFPY